MAPRTDRAYNVVKNYLWGGADKAAADNRVYYDETARRMLVSTRTSMVDVATQLLAEGDMALERGDKELARDKYGKSAEIIDLVQTKVGDKAAPYALSTALSIAQVNCELGDSAVLNDAARREKGRSQLLALIDKYARNVVYNQTMRFNFGNPQMTYENLLIPYQYYRFIDLYEKYGGERAKVDDILKRNGLSADLLKKDYEEYMRRSGARSSGAQSDGMTWEDFAVEIAKYCEIANELASLSPEEYAARSAEERSVDSVLYSVIEYYLQNGGKEEDLEKYEQYRKLDKARAKRLSDSSQGL